jgi:hypothetical protein
MNQRDQLVNFLTGYFRLSPHGQVWDEMPKGLLISLNVDLDAFAISLRLYAQAKAIADPTFCSAGDCFKLGDVTIDPNPSGRPRVKIEGFRLLSEVEVVYAPDIYKDMPPSYVDRHWVDQLILFEEVDPDGENNLCLRAECREPALMGFFVSLLMELATWWPEAKQAVQKYVAAVGKYLGVPAGKLTMLKTMDLLQLNSIAPESIVAHLKVLDPDELKVAGTDLISATFLRDDTDCSKRPYLFGQSKGPSKDRALVYGLIRAIDGQVESNDGILGIVFTFEIVRLDTQKTQLRVRCFYHERQPRSLDYFDQLRTVLTRTWPEAQEEQAKPEEPAKAQEEPAKSEEPAKAQEEPAQPEEPAKAQEEPAQPEEPAKAQKSQPRIVGGKHYDFWREVWLKVKPEANRRTAKELRRWLVINYPILAQHCKIDLLRDILRAGKAHLLDTESSNNFQ